MTTVYQSPILQDEDSENRFSPNVPTCREAKTNYSPRQHAASAISYSKGFGELPAFAHKKENNAPKHLAPEHIRTTNHLLHYSVGGSSVGKRKRPLFFHRKRTTDREARKAFRKRTQQHIKRLERRIKELSRESLSDDPEFDSAFAEEQRKTLKLEEELSQLQRMHAVEERQANPNP